MRRVRFASVAELAAFLGTKMRDRRALTLRRPPFYIAPSALMRAPMAELVDASDSKSDSARSAGSIPARGTNEGRQSTCGLSALPRPLRLRSGAARQLGPRTLAAHPRVELTWRASQATSPR